jgi:hypothetical protein
LPNRPRRRCTRISHPSLSKGNATEPKQWLTLIWFGLTILAVITNIIDNTLSALVGFALMGQAKGKYTFFGHLKWTPAIALGYAASIAVHFALNGALFHP